LDGLEVALDLNRYTTILQMMECLLAKMVTNQEEIRTNQTKSDANVRDMREEMRAGQELKEEMLAKMDARIDANNEKFEVL
jgi:hypothetical protein